MYVSVEFSRCISGNGYRSEVVYASSDAVFDALFVELAKSADLDTITLTVYHRPRGSAVQNVTVDVDERLGAVVVEAAQFGAWGQWMWLPLDTAPTAFLQFKMDCVPLDVALLSHQNKEGQRVDHYIAVHLDTFVPAEDSVMMAPSVQIEWEWDDEVFWTRPGRKGGGDGAVKWNESHFVAASLRTDDRSGDLKFFMVDDGTVCHFAYFVCFILEWCHGR